MSLKNDRIVITGLGALSPLGRDVASTWEGLLAGKSGVTRLPEDWSPEIPAQIAAKVAVEPAELMDRVEMRRLDRSEQFAVIAAREAWADAGSPEVDPTRLGVVIASGIGGVLTLLGSYDVLKEKGARSVSPHTVPMLMPNGPAAYVGLEFGAKAGVHTPVSACASGAEALGYALNMIRSGRADVVIAGGTEAAIHPLPMAGFANMKAAVMAATKNRINAIDALGDIPVKPERPVFAPPPVEPRKPVQNPKGNKNQKNPPLQPMQPNKPGGQNNQQPDPNVQSKVNKPAKNQNASGNAEIFESDFSA